MNVLWLLDCESSNGEESSYNRVVFKKNIKNIVDREDKHWAIIGSSTCHKFTQENYKTDEIKGHV